MLHQISANDPQLLRVSWELSGTEELSVQNCWKCRSQTGTLPPSELWLTNIRQLFYGRVVCKGQVGFGFGPWPSQREKPSDLLLLASRLSHPGEQVPHHNNSELLPLVTSELEFNFLGKTKVLHTGFRMSCSFPFTEEASQIGRLIRDSASQYQGATPGLSSSLFVLYLGVLGQPC